MAVTRCVCYRRSFGELKKLAVGYGWTKVAQISKHTGCGTGCGSCVPYLQAMLKTGHTCFAVRSEGDPPVPAPPDPWDPVEEEPAD
jgi:NAD(P)H-nitrite reductase large subunit